MKLLLVFSLIFCSAVVVVGQDVPPPDLGPLSPPWSIGEPLAQQQTAEQQILQRTCRGTEIKNGPEFDEIRRIMQRLAPVVNQDQQHRVYIALTNNNEINSWATNFSMTNSLICVPLAMVHFMSDEGELAFIIAHEIGHTVDDACKTQGGRVAVANSRGSLGALFGALLGGAQGAAAASKISQQRGCEARADEIGFRIFTAAGQNPYDAAGAFGRLEMYLGDTSTGILARLSAIGNDHPMTPDRIRHMRELLMTVQQTAATGH